MALISDRPTEWDSLKHDAFDDSVRWQRHDDKSFKRSLRIILVTKLTLQSFTQGTAFDASLTLRLSQKTKTTNVQHKRQQEKIAQNTHTQTSHK